MKDLRVYLVRHGKAVESGHRDDADRPLTSEGRVRMRKNGVAFIEAAHPAPERWIVSPLVRAVQTCEILVDAFGQSGPVDVARELAPEASVSGAASLLDNRDERAVALVGHEPLLSSLAAHLLGLPSIGVAFKKGAVFALDLPRSGGAGRLAFHLRPAGDEREPELREEL